MSVIDHYHRWERVLLHGCATLRFRELAGPGERRAFQRLQGWIVTTLDLNPLRATLTALSDILGRSDQSQLAVTLDMLSARLHAQPVETAWDVLSLFEDDRTFSAVVLTHGGVAFKQTRAEWEEALAFARLKHQLYKDALALWRVSRPGRFAQRHQGGPPERIVNLGWGGEVWRKGSHFYARYDCGSHMSRFREDEITEDEAEQASLGPRHFYCMLIELQHRLKAAGIDPYAGSPEPLPDLM